MFGEAVSEGAVVVVALKKIVVICVVVVVGLKKIVVIFAVVLSVSDRRRLYTLSVSDRRRLLTRLGLVVLLPKVLCCGLLCRRGRRDSGPCPAPVLRIRGRRVVYPLDLLRGRRYYKHQDG